MKYNDYIKSLEKFPHRNKEGKTLADMAGSFIDIWSNDACVGYCKLAMSAAGFDGNMIDEVVSYLETMFNDYSVDDAERHCIDVVQEDGTLIPF